WAQEKTIEHVPASTIVATLLARDLVALVPETSAYRRLFLASHLEAGKLLVGLSDPLPRGNGTVHSVASAAGAAALEDVLEWSLKNDHLPAAIGAVDVLGDIGDPSVLTSTTGAPRPLALALRHPNRQLRFAAVEAILKINAPHSFPGASYVP